MPMVQETDARIAHYPVPEATKRVFHMKLGKIVGSHSHIIYDIQVYGPQDVESVPSPAAYTFGCFVRIALPTTEKTSDTASATKYVVGVIYDSAVRKEPLRRTDQHHPNESNTSMFTPDMTHVQAPLLSFIALGTMEPQDQCREEQTTYTVTHGIPSFSLNLGCELETMTDDEVRLFHYFLDARAQQTEPTLNIGYVPHLLAHPHPLLSHVILRLYQQLVRLFPQHHPALLLMKHNLDWQLTIASGW